MGLFGWGKKEAPIEDKGWIKVRLSFYINEKLSQKEIDKEIKELTEVFINAQSFFDQNNNYLGYGNPKITPNGVSLLTYGKVKDIHARGLSKFFFIEAEKEKDRLRLIFSPQGKDSLYKLAELNEDLYILWQLDKFLRESYDIEGNPASFNTKFNGKKPAMEEKEFLMTFEYNVEDRIKYDANELAEKCLGDFYDKLEVVKKNKEDTKTRELKVTDAIERSNWLKAVEELMAKK